MSASKQKPPQDVSSQKPTGSLATQAEGQCTGPSPLIPDKYVDVPSQRLYALSLGLLCQAMKLADFLSCLLFGDDGRAKCRKWLLVDLIFCMTLAQLRIPRLNYKKAMVLLQIIVLFFLDGVMFGGITFNFSSGTGTNPSTTSFVGGQVVSSTSEAVGLAGYLSSLTFGIWGSSTPQDSDHLIGQHTVHMSPISTAQLNPHGLSYCLSPLNNFVLIPVLLNNTNLSVVKYTVTSLGNVHAKSETVILTAKELRAIEQFRSTELQLLASKAGFPGSGGDEEYDDDAAEDRHPQSLLQTTQTLVHIKLTKPGIIFLDEVIDSSDGSIRIIQPSTVTVAPCPSVEFIDEQANQDHIRCAGVDSELRLMILVRGIPPLSLRWLKTVNGKREHFLVEGIEGEFDNDSPAPGIPEDKMMRTTRRAPQELKIPLSVSLDGPGTYLYALEEVIDGIGNLVRLGSDGFEMDSKLMSQTKTTRSLMVLQRASFSFKNCRPGSPVSLLIGSETPLTISAARSDPFDSPWEVSLTYLPPVDLVANGKGNKRHKPWKKLLKTQDGRTDLTLRADAPGDYTILGVRGKWCSADVLSPESCKVLEKPLPTAEIEWKRIHECSGDTGVSASLTLHGSPPFQVYYTIMRDGEAPRESSKTFATSRGDLTLQPERSGHYTVTFVRISDAYYKKVDLNGSSIDQIIHPPAGADFVTATSPQNGNKRRISSCEGDTVPVDVDLKGTGPWNLEVQVVGPRSSETITFSDIKTSRKTLQILIPKDLSTNGGSFDVNIVSVQDVHKCKRPISVPGISVLVRVVKPTAKFYETTNRRRVTALENETVDLPLRLTGDSPWHIQYRRVGDDKILTKVLHNPNDHLTVSEKSIYELIGVADAYCRGSVDQEASTYEVDWIPRPSAQLAPQTRGAYEPRNGSYILSSVCDGTPDSVELDLKGHPPFQIMYNIAQATEMGGIELIDQPTFNSIQHRTRFQLQTSQPGRMYYEVKQIGDTNYPLSKHKDSVIPRSERLLFEQQVSPRPSAHFRNRNRLSYCLNDAFSPLDASLFDGTVLLDGTPPFVLTVSIRSIAINHIDTTTVKVQDHVWKMDLPFYVFNAIGPHLVTIESVRDASNCAPAALDPLSTTIWADVAETAAIVPFDKRADYCVGEVLQFELEGTPPWTIGYRLNGKLQTRETSASPFSIQVQQPGEFVIASIAHQQKMCKAVVADLHFNVHPLPSAQVGHGKKIYQDIHEGEQAEIVFTLIGEPPFTFTYQRSVPSSKKGGKPGKVLETHTVSRVNSDEYSIFSALEGTWTITSISDRYCRYPLPQPDVVIDKRH